MRLALLSVGRPAGELPVLADALGLSDGQSALDAGAVDHAQAGVDQAVAGLACDRLVLAVGDLAGLNLVLARLQRKGLLGELETAVLLERPGRYLSSLGLPADRDAQLRLARSGSARQVGVVKDDSGGVLVDSALLHAWPEPADGWWLRAMVDDQKLADGTARSLEVRRLGPSSLEATVRLGRLRSRSCGGRSLQLACDPAQVVADGVGRHRARSKRTFWSEPELWRLALPNA